MKQFKCSMAKKIESLAKKQESISGKYLMDPTQFEKDIREMIDDETQSILKGCDDEERRYYELALQIWDDCGYDYAGELYNKLQQQMYKYVSGTDYKMPGNFANIAWDWNDDHKDGISFYDLRKKLLDGVEDADTNEFSTWAIDWFFHAFGTYNMCYNYATELGEEADILQQEDEEERERENSDESKKKESLGKKNERGTTRIETYVGFDELLGYADAEYLLEDVVDVLSKYYTYEGEGDDIVFDEDQAKDDPEFTIKIEGGDERADFYSEDIFYVHLPNKEAAEELAKVLGGNVSESKKRSEKRTVQPPSYDVFTFDELSDQAKETARKEVEERILKKRGNSSDMLSDSYKSLLEDLFPNSDLDVQFSLAYCQGDGLNTYGKLKVDDLLNVDLTAYPFNGSGIKPLVDKDAIKAVCNKADVADIALENNHRYYYSLADRIEVVPDYDVELTDKETSLLGELETFARDVMGQINSQLEDDGYNWFYEVTDEDIQEEISSQELEFTEDGEIE